jgi:ribonuclease HI
LIKGKDGMLHKVQGQEYMVSDPRHIKVSFGRHATVFQAEIYAIIYCLLENIKRSYCNKRIFIFSDSQAVLKALNSFLIKPTLV